MRNQLLAKSNSQGQSKTVLEHTEDVVEAVDALFGSPSNPTRLGSRFCRMFQFEDFDRFSRNLTCAAALHDLGKANEEFQLAIDAANNGKRRDQAIRHEHISAILLTSNFGGPLRNASEIDWPIVLAAVVGHHRKTTFESAVCDPLKLNIDSPEFQQLLGRIEHWTGIRLVATETATMTTEELDEWFMETESILIDIANECKCDSALGRLHYAVNTALIIADTVASALLREDSTIRTWVERIFQENRVIFSRDIDESILQKRISELDQNASGTGCPAFRWSEFQKTAGELPNRALLLAPCGSGKTLAAWKWLAGQAKDGIRHAIFLYPTRATSTEGFRDYVAWAPEADATLLHGTAVYELEGMFSNPQEDDKSSGGGQYIPEKASSLGSIAYWDRRYFSATVDQFLSFLQWDYASVCKLPILADAAVVIDEVHSFNDAMFSSLENLLERLDIPILCMTATLPQQRRESLERQSLQCLDAYETDFPDLREVDNAGRYSVKRCSMEDAITAVQQAVESGRKVLWVVNTVDRAQCLFRRFLSLDLPTQLYCYHSRFKLDDRNRHHQRVVASFKPRFNQSCLAITTQVCEMGLDLDAELLVSEYCPPSSLVQRMGRANRARCPREHAGQVLVYESVSNVPYEAEELTACSQLVEQLSESQRISQSALNRALAGVASRDALPQSLTSFFRGGFITVGDYRDIKPFTKQAIIDSDLRTALDLKHSGQTVDGLILPVPRHVAASPAPRPLPRWLSVVSAEDYCPEIGYHEQTNRGEKSNEANFKEVEAWIL